MLRTRVIPCLQLIESALVKTVKFRKPQYIGDAINTVRIFNELEVDELCFLDIRASVNGTTPNIGLLKQIANECFMPLSYGGGIKTFETAGQILSLGYEKLVLNSIAFENLDFVRKLSEHYGSQAIVGSIDFKKNFFSKYNVYKQNGTEKVPVDPIEWAQQLESNGIGELLLTSIDRDGTWSGYELDIINKVSKNVNIPVIANGGAGHLQDLSDAVLKSGASAVAIGSMVVYQKKAMGVLINFPAKDILEQILPPINY